MKNKGLITALTAVLVLAFALAGHGQPTDAKVSKKPGAAKTVKKEAEQPVSAEEAFRKAYPNVRFDAITPTDIKGVYEVTVGTNIAYFAPEPGYLILGEIRGKGGVNITAKRRDELMAARDKTILAKVKDFPLEKAIKIGEGTSTVIEFTDPDCPYCRTASQFFAKKTDVTRYIFFIPLPGHPDAENKVKYVLCAPDRAAAYEEAMTGKLDSKKYEVCKNPEVDQLVALYKDVAMKAGIQSTPFFIVNGKAVSGADIPRIEEALKLNQKTGGQAPAVKP